MRPASPDRAELSAVSERIRHGVGEVFVDTQGPIVAVSLNEADLLLLVEEMHKENVREAIRDPDCGTPASRQGILIETHLWVYKLLTEEFDEESQAAYLPAAELPHIRSLKVERVRRFSLPRPESTPHKARYVAVIEAALSVIFSMSNDKCKEVQISTFVADDEDVDFRGGLPTRIEVLAELEEKEQATFALLVERLACSILRGDYFLSFADWDALPE